MIQNRTDAIHAAKDIEKQIALLQYKKLNHIRENKDVKEINSQIEKLMKGEFEESKEFKHKHLIKQFVDAGESKDLVQHKYKLNNMANVVTFLNSQRVYTELLERYNPGLTMKQDDNVRRTANRVGLSVPE